MHRVLLLGAGKIGCMIARFLYRTGDFDVRVADVDPNCLASLTASHPKIETIKLDASDHGAIVAAAKGRDSILSAMTFSFNPGIAKAALESGASYFDLTEDVETTQDDQGSRQAGQARADLHAAVRPGAGVRLDRGASTLRRSSTSSTRSDCASAHCRSSRPTR